MDRRQVALHRAYAVVVDQFNRLALVEPFPARVSLFQDRPYAVIPAEQITNALRLMLAGGPNWTVHQRIGFVGNADQMSDNTDFLSKPHHMGACRTLFAE